jgi:hypothetical protein
MREVVRNTRQCFSFEDLEISFMRKYLVLSGILLCLFAAGCSGPFAGVKVEPVVFAHPDEIVKDDGFVVLADRRVFAVMAFLNAVGYDEEVPNQQMHPVRVKVRKMIADNLVNSPEKLQAWRKYYQSRIMGAWVYANFALSLSSDFPFRRIRPDRELGYQRTGRELANFPEVLNDFWVTAKLDEVWSKVKGDYISEINKYDSGRMERQMTFLWQYLRMKRSDKYVIVQVPNPLERYATASCVRYENYSYSIDGPGPIGGGLNVHEYLHTFVNDLVEANYARQMVKLQEYFNAGKDAKISKPYPDPVSFTWECLVHALDHRLAALQTSDPEVRERIEANVDSLTKEGYTLLKPLYLLLCDFEKSDKPFDRFLPVMLEKLPEYSR